MTDQQTSNAKIVEAAKILGMEATYFSGLYTLRHNGEFIGQMSADAWLDHFRRCAVAAKRC